MKASPQLPLSQLLFRILSIFLTLFVTTSICLSQVNEKENTFVVSDSVRILLNKTDEHTRSKELVIALDYAMQALNYAKKNKDVFSQAKSSREIGLLKVRLGDNDEGFIVLEEALTIAESIQDRELIASCYNALGIVNGLPIIGDKGKAIEYFEKALAVAKEMNAIDGVFVYTSNIAALCFQIGEYKKGFDYLKKQKALYQLLDEEDKGPIRESRMEGFFARYYKITGNYNKALSHLRSAIKIVRGKDLQMEEIFQMERIAVLKLQKKYKQALAVADTVQVIIDSIRVSESKKLIDELEEKFEAKELQEKLITAKKEKVHAQELADSRKKIIVFGLITTLFLFLCIGLTFVYFSYKRKNKSLRNNNALLEEQKKRAEYLNKLKSEFIANVSHELRTPLYGVIGITSLLMQEQALLKKHEKLLTSLQFSGDYLLSIINKVLRLGSFDTEKDPLVLENVNLKKLIDNIVSGSKAFAKERGNKITVTLDNEIAPNMYLLDKFKLSEILYNIINNAIKFTNNGDIYLKVEKQKSNKTEDTIYFAIEDTGIGIAKQKRDAIFERFNQGQEENTYQGIGLGLYLVENLLSQMGAKIGLSSVEGEGSTFSFILKVKKDDNLRATSNTSTPSDAYTVLIAEDNKISAMVTEKLLTALGHLCIMAKNGEEAHNLYQTNKIDFVLMDLNMPICDGYDASRIIMNYDSNAYIVALTAANIDIVEKECLEIGMQEVLNKPINLKGVKTLIQKFEDGITS